MSNLSTSDKSSLARIESLDDTFARYMHEIAAQCDPCDVSTFKEYRYAILNYDGSDFGYMSLNDFEDMAGNKDKRVEYKSMLTMIFIFVNGELAQLMPR